MARCIELQPGRTYATKENAVKAVEKYMDRTVLKAEEKNSLTYFVQQHTDGRYYPVFIGERAVHALIHFQFNVVA